MVIFTNFTNKEKVNSPSHYTEGGLETIDILSAKLSKEGLRGFLLGNVIKYITRAGHKESEKTDLDKARWYLDKLIEEIKNGAQYK